MTGLNILSYNATSLINRTRRVEINDTINKTEAMVVLLQETRLNPKHSLVLSRMKVYRNDEGVGTAIGVKFDLAAERVPLTLKFINCTAVAMKTKKGKILIVSIYVPCNLKCGDMAEDLEKIQNATEEYSEVILGGDWNAHHSDWETSGSDKVDTAGRTIVNHVKANGELRIIAPPSPTFRGISTIDFFIISRTLAVAGARITTGPDEPDHAHIILKLEQADTQKREKTVAFVYKDVDWEKFKETTTHELAEVRTHKHRNLTNEEIDGIINEVSEGVRRAMDKCVRKRVVCVGETEALPEEIECLIKKRRSAIKERRRARANCNNGWLELMDSVVKETTAEIKRGIAKYENEKLIKRLQGIQNNSEAFKTINQLAGKKAKRAEECDFETNGVKVITIEGKAEVMRKYYEDLYKENTPTNELLPQIEQEVKETEDWRSGIVFTEANNALNPKDSEWSVSGMELEGIRRRMNNKKSCGEDGLPNFILKRTPRLFWDITRTLMNNCIANSYFPTAWKKAIIVPIPKTPSAATPKEFRPISMLSNWGKVLEEVIMMRMKNDEGEIKGVPTNQFAYRPGHSALHAVDLLCAEARENKRKGKSTAVVSMDVTKAFDSVWRKGLIHKLKANGEHNNTTAIINSFMTNRTARVRMGETMSGELRLERGVPQGSKLGPILYSIYTASVKVRYDEKQGAANYADDILFWCSGKGKGQIKDTIKRQVNIIKKEMSKWGIQINEAKTNLMLVEADSTSGRKIGTDLRNEGVWLGNQQIKANESLKYLGITINESLTNNHAMNHATRKAGMAYGKLKWIITKKETNMQVKRLIYKQLIRPCLTYGMPILTNTNEKALRKLGLFERKIVRGLTGRYRREDGRYYSNADIYKAVGLEETIEEHVNKLKEKYESKKECHRNAWYRERMAELQKRSMEMLSRNMEYKETTRLWKAEKHNTTARGPPNII